MADIKDWANTAAGNNRPGPPDYAQEDGTTVAELNDCQRELQAAVRRDYETRSWTDYGLTISATGSNSVTFSDPITGFFHVEQRVEVTHAGGTSYASILTVDEPGGIITLDIDGGGTLTAPATVVKVGVDPTGNPTGAANPYTANQFTAPQEFADQVIIRRADSPLLVDAQQAGAANNILLYKEGAFTWAFSHDAAGDFIIAEQPANTRLFIQAGTSASLEIGNQVTVNSSPVITAASRNQTVFLAIATVLQRRNVKFFHNLGAAPIAALFQFQNISGSARGDIPNNGIINVASNSGQNRGTGETYHMVYDNPADGDYLNASFFTISDAFYVPNGNSLLPIDLSGAAGSEWQVRILTFT